VAALQTDEARYRPARWLEFAWTSLNQQLASAVFIDMRWNWEGICYLGWVNGYRRLSENG